MTGEVQSTIHDERCSSISHLACSQTATHQWNFFTTVPAAWTTKPKRTHHSSLVNLKPK